LTKFYRIILELLISRTHLGLKLIMDFVPNHSSDLHEWFGKSVLKVDPYTDYYVWKDPSGRDEEGRPMPPNNWVKTNLQLSLYPYFILVIIHFTSYVIKTSWFGGSMWEWNESRGQFYLHQFVKEQPDLNLENPLVWNEMLAVEKFWLDMGVDGFRIDAVLTMFEDQRFLDEPIDPDRDPAARPDEHRYYLHPYTYDQPKVMEWLANFRQLIEIYSAADGRDR
jgi:alpha-glucosidase